MSQMLMMSKLATSSVQADYLAYCLLKTLCHNMLPASIIGKVSAATNVKLQHGANLLSSAAAISKPLAVLTPFRKVLQHSRLFTLGNIFRQKSLGLQPEG